MYRFVTQSCKTSQQIAATSDVVVSFEIRLLDKYRRIAWLTFYLLTLKKHHNVNRGFTFMDYFNSIPMRESSNL